MYKVGLFCPKCGSNTLSIHIKNSEATIKCSMCTIDKEVKCGSYAEPLDVYGDLIDEIYENRVNKSKTTTWDELEKGYLEWP